jgi:hypothetical protein
MADDTNVKHKRDSEALLLKYFGVLSGDISKNGKAVQRFLG